MSLEILSSDKVLIRDRVDDWKHAIRVASKPLLEQGYFKQQYIEKMIYSVEELGPYIEIAIAHARPSDDVKKIGLSLLKLNHHINFSENGHHASLVFVLSAVDNEGHLEILRNLATILGDSNTVNKLLVATDIDEIINIFKGE